MTDVHCPCGAIHLEVSAEPIAQFFCHCADCRAVHGAGYVPVALYPEAGAKITQGTPKAWKLRTMPRMACPECGTRVFADPVPGMRGVIGTLLPAGMFKPTMHIHCGSAVRPVKDDLPHFKDMPTQFGGTGDAVGW
jgi:hypothetical protein